MAGDYVEDLVEIPLGLGFVRGYVVHVHGLEVFGGGEFVRFVVFAERVL